MPNEARSDSILEEDHQLGIITGERVRGGFGLGAEVIGRTSIRTLGEMSALPFSQLLRGATSLGGLLEAEDVPSVPSPADPSPGDAPYFRGGYNTREHGSLAAGETVSGIQVEHHYRGVRDTDGNQRDYAARAARALRRFMLEHYGEHYAGIWG